MVLLFLGYIFKLSEMKFISNQWAVASGSINGTVYSRNRFSAYTRNRTNPSNPQSEMQTISRSILSALASAWKELTDAERSQWDSAGDLYTFSNNVDGTYHPTGFQLYQTQNINLMLQTTAPTDTPLPLGSYGNITGYGALIDISAGTFTVHLTSDITSNSFKVFATGYVSAGLGAGSVKNKFRLLRNADTTPFLGSSSSTGEAIANEYSVQFGVDLTPAFTPPANSAIWVKLVGTRSDMVDIAPLVLKVTFLP